MERASLLFKPLSIALIGLSLSYTSTTFAASNTAPVSSQNAVASSTYYKLATAKPTAVITSPQDWQTYLAKAQTGDVVRFNMNNALPWSAAQGFINNAISSPHQPGLVSLNTDSANAFTLKAGDAEPWLANGTVIGVGQNVSLEDSDAWSAMGTNDAPLFLSNLASNTDFEIAGKNLRNGIYQFANNDQTQAYFNGLNQWSSNGKPTALFVGEGAQLSQAASYVKKGQYAGLGYAVTGKTTPAQAQQIGTTMSAPSQNYAFDMVGTILAASVISGLVAGMTAAAWAPPYYSSYGWGGGTINNNIVNNYTVNRGGNAFTLGTDGAIDQSLLNSGALKNGTLVSSDLKNSVAYAQAVQSGQLANAKMGTANNRINSNAANPVSRMQNQDRAAQARQASPASARSNAASHATPRNNAASHNAAKPRANARPQNHARSAARNNARPRVNNEARGMRARGGRVGGRGGDLRRR